MFICHPPKPAALRTHNDTFAKLHCFYQATLSIALSYCTIALFLSMNSPPLYFLPLQCCTMEFLLHPSIALFYCIARFAPLPHFNAHALAALVLSFAAVFEKESWNIICLSIIATYQLSNSLLSSVIRSCAPRSLFHLPPIFSTHIIPTFLVRNAYFNSLQLKVHHTLPDICHAHQCFGGIF